MSDVKRADGRRRVVVTGLGAVTPVGQNATDTWASLIAGRSGVGPVTQFDASNYPTRIAAEVKDFDPRDYLERKEARYMARCSQLAVVASEEALRDAGLTWPLADGATAGVSIGTGVGGFELYSAQVRKLSDGRVPRINPVLAINGLGNMPAYHLTVRYGCKGPSKTIVTACAAGTQAVGDGVDLIRHQGMDVVLSGGVEALIIDLFFATFGAMGILSTRNDCAEQAVRPFDESRDGFVVGEGAAVLVLESLEHAQSRGARIYAEVLGHSASADAYHLATPDPEAQGARNAMRWALDDAQVAPDEVDYINAHGTATRVNDPSETMAIKRTFGEHAYRVPISSTKSMIGHCFGGAGAIEALACVYSVHQNIIHPTINLETPDPECDLDYVPNEARRTDVSVALSNSFGLGGQNACLVVGEYRQ
jgi:3-oxoacyl-[acyl-carrier-protein] synthase II